MASRLGNWATRRDVMLLQTTDADIVHKTSIKVASCDKLNIPLQRLYKSVTSNLGVIWRWIVWLPDSETWQHEKDMM